MNKAQMLLLQLHQVFSHSLGPDSARDIHPHVEMLLHTEISFHIQYSVLKYYTYIGASFPRFLLTVCRALSLALLRCHRLIPGL